MKTIMSCWSHYGDSTADWRAAAEQNEGVRKEKRGRASEEVDERKKRAKTWCQLYIMANIAPTWRSEDAPQTNWVNEQLLNNDYWLIAKTTSGLNKAISYHSIPENIVTW